MQSLFYAIAPVGDPAVRSPRSERVDRGGQDKGLGAAKPCNLYNFHCKLHDLKHGNHLLSMHTANQKQTDETMHAISLSQSTFIGPVPSLDSISGGALLALQKITAAFSLKTLPTKRLADTTEIASEHWRGRALPKRLRDWNGKLHNRTLQCGFPMGE